MVDKLIEELNELKEYKNKYEFSMKDKQKMSDLLFQYMTKEYESKTTEEHIREFRKNSCSCCRHCDECEVEDIPDDVGKPIPSEKAWIPTRKSCGSFRWS